MVTPREVIALNVDSPVVLHFLDELQRRLRAQVKKIMQGTILCT